MPRSLHSFSAFFINGVIWYIQVIALSLNFQPQLQPHQPLPRYRTFCIVDYLIFALFLCLLQSNYPETPEVFRIRLALVV